LRDLSFSRADWPAWFARRQTLLQRILGARSV
jgi:hypothetical protein